MILYNILKHTYVLLYLLACSGPLLSLPLTRFDEKALDRSIESLGHGGQAGALIIETSHSFQEYIYNPDLIKKTKLCPGSIAKIWSTSVIIDDTASAFREQEDFFCNGVFRVPDNISLDSAFKKYNFRSDSRGNYLSCSLRDGHKKIGLLKALSVSCNNYFLTASSRDPDLFYLSLSYKWKLPGFQEELSDVHREPWMKMLSAIGEGPLMTMTPADVAVRLAAFWGETPVMSLHRKGEEFKIIGKLEVSGTARNMIKGALRRALAEGTLKTLEVNRRGLLLFGGKTGTGTIPGALYSVSGWNAIFFSWKEENFLLLTVCRRGVGRGIALDLSRTILTNIRWEQ